MLVICSLTAIADVVPTVKPTMTIELSTGDEEQESYSGSAPIIAHFKANPSDAAAYQAIYTWYIYRAGQESNPYVVRYDEDMDYTFMTSEVSYITLSTTFINGTDTISYTMDTPFSVSVSKSKLELPNAFSPNGDGINDVYKVKSGYESIVSFKGTIFNRWGKKIFEWTDIDSGWDGQINGSPAHEGVYYCIIQAKGADGINYNLKRDVNLLRKYTESTTTSP